MNMKRPRPTFKLIGILPISNGSRQDSSCTSLASFCRSVLQVENYCGRSLADNKNGEGFLQYLFHMNKMHELFGIPSMAVQTDVETYRSQK